MPPRKIWLALRKIFLFVCENRIFFFFLLLFFSSFFGICLPFCGALLVFLAHNFAKIYKTDILTAQKNLHLECLLTATLYSFHPLKLKNIPISRKVDFDLYFISLNPIPWKRVKFLFKIKLHREVKLT